MYPFPRPRPAPRWGRRTTLAIGLALALSPVAARTAAAQSTAGPGWRLSAGAGVASVLSSYPGDDAWDRAPLLSLGLERQLGHRLALGLQWVGLWYDSTPIRKSRHALLLTATATAPGGLRLTAGIGPGTATYVHETPPVNPALPGDVLVDYEDGASALVLTGIVAYPLSLGPFSLEPNVRILGHHLRGETMGAAGVGLRLVWRTGR